MLLAQLVGGGATGARRLLLQIKPTHGINLRGRPRRSGKMRGLDRQARMPDRDGLNWMPGWVRAKIGCHTLLKAKLQLGPQLHMPTFSWAGL